jgi:hypothetical protein
MGRLEVWRQGKLPKCPWVEVPVCIHTWVSNSARGEARKSLAGTVDLQMESWVRTGMCQRASWMLESDLGAKRRPAMGWNGGRAPKANEPSECHLRHSGLHGRVRDWRRECRRLSAVF